GTLTLQQAGVGTEDGPLFLDLRGRIQAIPGPPLDAGARQPAPASGAGAPATGQRTRGRDPATIFTAPWIGTDEAGKGDYFGPLVAAAVYVDTEAVRRLTRLGVRDSKTLSDGRVRQLADAIRDACGARAIAVVTLPPDTYNRLYEQFQREGKALNALLAWAHARAIEELLNNGLETPNVIVDQFAGVQTITSALLREGRARGLNLVAVPRAEANVAVAAASILARARFLAWMEATSREIGITLPKGASDAVVQAARAVVSRLGPERLRALAKLHFKTTRQVLPAATASEP